MPGLGNDAEVRRVETLSAQVVTVSKPVGVYPCGGGHPHWGQPIAAAAAIG